MVAADDKSRKNGEYLTTLARGLSVLRSFTKERPEMTLSEVAVVTGLSPAVARRCLNTLLELGYVGRKGKLFLLTPEVMGFASAFLESMNLEEVVRPYLQEVRDSTGDSSSLAVLSHHDILYLVHVSTNRMVRLVAGFGTRLRRSRAAFIFFSLGGTFADIVALCYPSHRIGTNAHRLAGVAGIQSHRHRRTDTPKTPIR